MLHPSKRRINQSITIMKNIYFLLAVSLFLASCGPTTVIQSDNYEPAPAPQPVMDVSYQSFYDQLSPYGNWINYPGYGYVWMPNAGPDFRPYGTNGNWIYTDAGWTWASNYNWGWAPFHYGRWFFENGYGWMWVPGNEWAPAWVSWRGGGDYYGWAPLGPRISVEVAMNSYNPPAYYWNFVPRQYMGNPGWYNYHVHENRNVTIINNTTIINNYSGTNRNRYAYAPGPDPNEVRRVSGNNFNQVQIREANTPGERISGSQYVIYHPRVSNSNTTAARGDASGRPSTPAPARYESFNNLRPSSQYPSYNQGNNNTPANNPRPAGQNSGYSQANGNPAPAGNSNRPGQQNQPAYQPANNPPAPVSNPRPASQVPSNNQPANNPPSNNNRPAGQNVNTNPQQAVSSQTAENRMQETRMNQLNQTHRNAGTPTYQPQSNTLPKPSPANQVQTTGRPTTVHNPNTGQPVQRAQKPAEKPVQQSAEKPKTREAENN
jgi:hypothetical protein